MVYSQEFLANMILWISGTFFIISLIPQIFLNHKLKTAQGWSDLFILGKFNSQICNLGFTFSTALPLAYKVLSPLYFTAAAIIVFQRLYYLDYKQEKKVLWLYLANILLVFGMISVVVSQFPIATLFLGWIPVIISLWKMAPQVLKIHLNKSARGFSLGFILITLMAYLIEIGGVLMLRLPGQILWQDLKGPLVYLILLAQFAWYRQATKSATT